MSAYTHQGQVYFARCGGYVKIGYSSGRLEARLAGLLLGRGVICPDDLDKTQPLEVVHTIPGCVIRDERRLHGMFNAHHVAGEWYRYDLAFMRQLDGMNYVTYAETLRQFRRVRAELKQVPTMKAAA